MVLVFIEWDCRWICVGIWFFIYFKIIVWVNVCLKSFYFKEKIYIDYCIMIWWNIIVNLRENINLYKGIMC